MDRFRCGEGGAASLLLYPSIRGVQQLDRVHDPDREPSLSQALLDLKGAAGVAADDDIGPRLLDPIDLPIEQLLSRFGMQQIVDPGAAAAEVGLFQLDEPEPGDLFEECPCCCRIF